MPRRLESRDEACIGVFAVVKHVCRKYLGRKENKAMGKGIRTTTRNISKREEKVVVHSGGAHRAKCRLEFQCPKRD